MSNFFEDRRDFLTNKRGKFVSQHSIAVAIGVTPALVGLWEREELAPNLKISAKIAEAYEVEQEVIEQEIVAMARRITSRRQQQAAPA